ncbi:hypothetical protein Trydic_g9110 [Trypoxylus dichotomus]
MTATMPINNSNDNVDIQTKIKAYCDVIKVGRTARDVRHDLASTQLPPRWQHRTIVMGIATRIFLPTFPFSIASFLSAPDVPRASRGGGRSYLSS